MLNSRSLKFLMLLVLSLCASSMATLPSYTNDVYPFTFGTQDTATQLSLWNRLMKYKLFATGLADGKGITSEEKVHITDPVGYVGSATGNFEFYNNEHVFGGPILFGGEFKAGTGNDTLINGPTRFKGAFNAGPNKYSFVGKYCFDGGKNAYAE